MDWNAFWNDSAQVRDSDFRRQVGRTFRGEPYSDRQLDAVLAGITSHLRPSPELTLFELACGNGLLTVRLAPLFKRITAVDFSRPLIETANRHFKADNITYQLADVSELQGVQGAYDRVLMSAALQHLSAAQAERMFARLAQLVKPGGLIVLADVADGDRIWHFYRGISGRARYLLDRARGRATLGYWWTPVDLLRHAQRRGWSLSIHYQTPENPNHYFRFDAVLRVPDGSGGPSSPAR
jgi:2-polyprenyl-3-methyl-5-hydroxy-6-metoxy-1,4-benzoquinol methylase